MPPLTSHTNWQRILVNPRMSDRDGYLRRKTDYVEGTYSFALPLTNPSELA
jgi:hypothetical protein